MFATDHIYEKFIKASEKGSTVRVLGGFVGALDPRKPAAITSAQYLMTPPPTCSDDPAINALNGTCAKFMMWDAARVDYIEAAWNVNDPLFGGVLTSILPEGKNDAERTKALGLGNVLATPSDYTPIEALSYLSTQYNLGEYTANVNDSAPVAAEKAVRSTLVKLIQTSLSGCLTWSMPFKFVFGDDNTCVVEGAATFEYRIHDELSAKRNKRRLVMAGKPKFTFIPEHPWGTQFAGNMPDDGTIGAYAPLEVGGVDNPQNVASAELDVSYNPNTGKAEAGTHQMLAKMITPLSRVKINPLPADVEGAAMTAFLPDGSNDTTHFASGYAIPLKLHQGNPNLFSPTLDERGTGCSSNKKARVLVINRSQRSFPIGRVVLLQRIDDEWIPIDFGDDDSDDGGLKVGKWGFQYLIADADSYFKDDRYYYEEQYQPELSSSITPAQYESMFRSNFYSSITSLLLTGASHLDQANRGNGQLENSVTPPPTTAGCTPTTTGVTGVQPGVPIIEALNGAWVKTTSYYADPGCYKPSDNCKYVDEINALLANGGDIENYLGTAPDGQGTLIGYDGIFTLDKQPSYSNFSSNRYPTELYTKTQLYTPTFNPQGFTGGLRDPYYPFGAKIWVTGTNAGPGPMGLTMNMHNCTYMIDEYQTQDQINLLTASRRKVVVGVGYEQAALVVFIKALRDKFKALCDAEKAASPQVTEHKWSKAINSKTFVGSRRYLNVTSFDMCSDHWNGHSPIDWLSRCNPKVSYDGGVIDDPSDQSFNLFSPFWGAVFTDGYTQDSVDAFMAKRGSNVSIAKACSNALTGGLTNFICDSYLKDGKQNPTAANSVSYGRNINGAPASLDTIYEAGDSIDFANLPADIGTNASPSGKYGTPIPDFDRMVNLVNIEVHGSYDPIRGASGEPPSIQNEKYTLDWGDGKRTVPRMDLAHGVQKYFAKKSYNFDGVEFKIPDRYSWVYRLSSAPTADLNGNITGGKITKQSMDSWYDLQPLSPGNVTFVPLTAEWIGAFDSHDFIYSTAATRARKESFLDVSYAGHTIPASVPTGNRVGAGWYWGDATAALGHKDLNITCKRLLHYPLAGGYFFRNNPGDNRGSEFISGNSRETFPDGSDYTDTNQGYGGRRGDPIFTIGRNNNYVAAIIEVQASTAATASTAGAGMVGVSAGDFEFMETENPGGIMTQDIHGITAGFTAGTNAPDHTVKMEPGFPYDGYVRHRSKDSVVTPLNTWFPEGAYSADCVGIITAKTAFSSSSNSMVIETEDTRGLPAAKLTVGGEPVGQWGNTSSNISSMGGSHLFARVFEAWPDEQTLFDARYFAVMHFNQGTLVSPPEVTKDVAPFPYDGKTYIRQELTTDVDFRIPTKKGSTATNANGHIDATVWDEYSTGKTIYSDIGDMAPEPLWRVTTVRRGMLLPFTYLVPTIGVNSDHIHILDSALGNSLTGTGFKVGDTLTFVGGVGKGAQIRILNVDPGTGAIIHQPAANPPAPGWKLISEGEDYVPSDFMAANWHAIHTDPKTRILSKDPLIRAVPDEGVNGKDAAIVVTAGVTLTKEVKDEAPKTAQNSPVRITHAVPNTSLGGIGREEARGGAVSLSLYGADGATTKYYDTFLHFHNDITSVFSYDSYSTVAQGKIKDNCKVQFLSISISSR